MLTLDGWLSRPVLHSIVHGESVLNHLAPHHRLDGPLRCDLLRSNLNDTYLLVAGGDRYVARLYHGNRAPTEVEHELQLLNHLAARGVPVCPPIPTRDGHLTIALRAPEGTRSLVLFEYASGATMSWDAPSHCTVAGHLLALIHSATSDFNCPLRRRELNEDYLIDAPLQTLWPFLIDRPADRAYLMEFTSRLRARLMAIADVLDVGVCHGDFEGKNIHMAQDGTATVLDFDYSGTGWRAYDFAPMWRSSRYKKNEESWEAFLSGYSDVRSVTAVDTDAAMLFHALRQLAMIGVLACNVDEWGAPRVTGRRLDVWLDSFRAWERHVESV